MRYTTSILAAVVISFFAFLGMSMLIASPKSYQASDFSDINFSLVDEMDTPAKVDRIDKTLPEQEKVKQPPVAPSIDITEDTDRDTVKLPQGDADLKNMEIDGLDIPLLPNLITNKNGFDNSGDMMQVIGIQPMYPREAALAGIEGWVKVEISVNEYGLVSDVKVIESSPRRIFDQATLRAVRKSKFKPLIIDGVPHAQTAVQVIEFKLDQK